MKYIIKNKETNENVFEREFEIKDSTKIAEEAKQFIISNYPQATKVVMGTIRTIDPNSTEEGIMVLIN